MKKLVPFSMATGWQVSMEMWNEYNKKKEREMKGRKRNVPRKNVKIQQQ